MRAAFITLVASSLLASPSLARDDFFGRTVGSLAFDDADPPVLTGTLEQFFITFKGPVTFETMLLSFTLTQHDQGPDDLSGAFTFFGSDFADSLSGTFTGTNLRDDDAVWNGVGSWTATMGTGAFAGLSGEGTLTTAFFINDASAATAFDGVIVPAPPAAALFTLGLLSPRRRR